MFLQAVVADDLAFERHALRALDRTCNRLLRLLHDLLLFFLLFLLLLAGGFRLALFFGLACGLDFLLALFLELLDKFLHHLLVAFEFLQRPLLHRLVVLERKEHLFLATHLVHQSLLLARLLCAQAVQFRKVFLFAAFLLVALLHHRGESFHLYAVLVQHVVHPVGLAFGVPLLRKQLIQDLCIAVAPVHVKLADSLLHRLLAHGNLLVKRVDIARKLFHGLLH